jgi:A/G-specific adenine glycosylase
VKNLLRWYAVNARSLPWRGLNNPYATWVSEIMLQQTRVETVIPYFERWMKLFPTIDALAAAPLGDILAAWEGLGYYGRARNLHEAARIVVSHFGGQLPRDLRKLRSLPGIGRYTAGAIASIAFGLDVPALDGNIRRVLSRLFDISEPVQSPAGEKILWELAGANLPPGQAGDYNQALMELGALICTPRSPDCGHCPLSAQCKSFQSGNQEFRPVLRARTAIPHHTVTAAVIQREGKVLITQRPLDGLLGGLWEFPGGKLQAGESLQDCLVREIQEELGVKIQVGEKFGSFNHAYTHFRVTLHAFLCCIENGSEPIPIQAKDLRWVSPGELAAFPMGKIDRQISRKIQ